MKRIITIFILGTIIFGSCGNRNEGGNKTSYPKDSVVYDDVEIHVSKIKIEGHDYYKVASKLDKNVSIEHLSTCKKCYDVFD